MDTKESLEYIKLQKMIRSIDLKGLPDGGRKILNRLEELEKKKNKQFVKSFETNDSKNDYEDDIEEDEDEDEEESEESIEISNSDSFKNNKKSTKYRNVKEISSNDDDDDEDSEGEDIENTDDEEDEDDDDNNEYEEEDNEDENETSINKSSQSDENEISGVRVKGYNRKGVVSKQKIVSSNEEESVEDVDENNEEKFNKKTKTLITDDDSSDRSPVLVDTDDEQETVNKKIETKESTSNKKTVTGIEIINDSFETLDTEKLDSINKKNEHEVNDKLKSLGLNDTIENKSNKNVFINDSIECLNDSSFPTTIDNLKKQDIILDDTPESELTRKYKSFPKITSIKYNDSSMTANESPLNNNNNISTKIDDLKKYEYIKETPEGTNKFELNSKTENSKYINNKIDDSIGEINNIRKDESSDDIVEIIDSPVKERKNVYNSPALKRYEQDQRHVPSWSPNFEQLKARIAKNTQEQRKIKIIDEPTIKKDPDASELKAQSYNFDHFGDSISSSSNRFRNRNLAYEELLKKLSENLIRILETKPHPDNFESNSPSRLKIKLLDHQYYALAWLKWREATAPRGGILADDMGLGKTLTILSYLQLIKEQREEQQKQDEEEAENDENIDENENDDDDDDDDEAVRRRRKKFTNSSKKTKVKKLKTLIIVPASLLHQWRNEIENRFEKNSFKYHVYHEANRKKYAYNLDDNDIVFTTYEIVTRELETLGDAKDDDEIKELLRRSNSPLARIKWKRIILDEAHRIKNHTTKANKIICALNSKYRIAMTGTPVQNSLNDFYSLVKFLHLEPLNDHKVWKYLFGSEKAAPVTRPQENSKSKNAETRDARYSSWLLILSDSLILRRTKADKVSVNGKMKSLVALPEKAIEIVHIQLNKTEKFIYDKIFGESVEKVKKFLIQQQKKLIGVSNGGSFSEILVYLLRLRQACSHISLLSECLDLAELQRIKNETEDVESLMQNLSLSSSTSSSINDLNVLNDINGGADDLDACVDKRYKSAKIVKLLEMVDDITTNHEEDKIIIVSQWTSLLNIIGHHLRERNLEFYEIRGDVNLLKRNELVESFNKPYNTDVKIMLLSLNAGGVGLNLVGANRMFLLDIHWNPALEQQAGDRIYRVGQNKNVNIYRFICDNTIEERIEQIQQFKIDVANRVCNAKSAGGSSLASRNTKLTIQDIKLLFQGFDDNNAKP